MGKSEHYLYVGNKNFYVLNKDLQIVDKQENNGIFNLENFKTPVSSFETLSNVFYDLHAKHPFNTVLLSDICFNSQVIEIENFPFSYSKREEVLTWKLSTLLPYKIDSYKIRYQLIEKDTVLFYALPITLHHAVNKLSDNLKLKCWNIFPESVFITSRLNETSKNTLFLLNRKDYFMAAFFKKGLLVYLKVRKKVKGIPLEKELELIDKIINEKFNIEIEEKLLCGGDNMPGFKQIFKGFGFEN